MGFDCGLQYIGKFQYCAALENGLIENEIDHVYLGEYNKKIQPDPEEVAEFEWVKIKDLKLDLSLNPQKYTVWFQKIMQNSDFELLT